MSDQILAERKRRFLTAVTRTIEEAHDYIDYLDEEHPDLYLQNSHLFRQKLETALDAIHTLLRDDKLREAVEGHRQLTHLIIEFTTSVAVEMKRNS